ncbi:MAG: hypothetical protein U5R49_18175 [Deltaproteobacteria bacterium]|nr:hypothetical protein [Deltaproteobacteria bacterium]
MKTDKTILVAEKERKLSTSLREFSDYKGYALLKAVNLREMLLMLQEERVDVLVLDADLLEEDYGFLSVIKGMEKDLPLIICAESNTPELESEIRRQRIFYYHINSFGMEDLQVAISNAING